jgi:hypothetical protein
MELSDCTRVELKHEASLSAALVLPELAPLLNSGCGSEMRWFVFFNTLACEQSGKNQSLR